MNEVMPIVPSDRNCDGCTACCDGWLAGKVNEHYFYPGKKCYYVTDNGCSIYNIRPEMPCRNFSCGWLIDKDVPEWMKPSNIQAIILSTRNNELIEQIDKSLTLEIFAWFKNLYNQGKIKKIQTQSEEEFLLEIKETIKKYGKHLLLLTKDPVSEKDSKYVKIKIDRVQVSHPTTH
jgi:hypothetical protein